MVSCNVQDQRRGFHAKHQEISAAKRDIHYHSQGRTSERKRLQHQLSQIRAVSTKRIQVPTAIAKLLGPSVC